jgi:hypothetical protein
VGGWRGDGFLMLNDFTQLLMVTWRPDCSISVAQPFQIQLKRLGNIVVYFFADFVNGKKVVAFAKISLFATPLL